MGGRREKNSNSSKVENTLLMQKIRKIKIKGEKKGHIEQTSS